MLEQMNGKAADWLRGHFFFHIPIVGGAAFYFRKSCLFSYFFYQFVGICIAMLTITKQIIDSLGGWRFEGARPFGLNLSVTDPDCMIKVRHKKPSISIRIQNPIYFCNQVSSF